MTATKPATPLPWTDIDGLHNGIVGRSASSLRVAKEVKFADDRAYIVHAANAYPELVAALRQLVTHMDAIVPATKQNARDNARSLLAKLGEG
jgi:hypothetical protein